MELRQLAYFVAVAEEGSFTRAADRVRVAQPGVSAQVKQLERELGQSLLDRSGRTVRLTEVGVAVLPYARAALAAAAATKSIADDFTGLLRGRIAVGMITSCGPLGLPEILAGFHQRHPAVEITLSEANSDELTDALRAGALDAAVIGLADAPPAGLETQVVTDEPIACAVAAAHPLAAAPRVRLADLRDRPLISLPRGTGIRARFEAACTAAGFAPAIAFEASDPHLLADLAARGLGVAILPSSILDSEAPAQRDQPGLVGLDLVEPGLRGQLAFAWRAEGPRGPAADAFLGHARATLRGASSRL